ncbi:GNAT family N-acetyltransferase [Streptomyces uncialis]|uniref:GNAT family N-acetyltransferase n=1 Tax=Streptomyces uncialis TaxID=1048205 RepID=UPI00340AE190
MDALRRQVTGHLKRPGFTLAVAHEGGAAVGFGYAFPCSADYWFGPDLVDRVPEGARTERLMGLCELAVQPDWQGRGIGTRLHAELIASIAPRWSPLLALPSQPARQGPVRTARLRVRGPVPQFSPRPGIRPVAPPTQRPLRRA